MSFLDDYEPVAARLEKFWADHPDGRVVTELVEAAPIIIFRADLYRSEGDPRPYSTGWAHQKHLEQPPAGRNGKPNDSAPEWTSPFEVCETSAVGRALANANYATKERRPSREEMQAAEQNRPLPPPLASDLDVTAFLDSVKAQEPEIRQAMNAWWAERKFKADTLTVEQLAQAESKWLEIVGAGGTGDREAPDLGGQALQPPVPVEPEPGGEHGYAAWPRDDLAAECAERGLPKSGPKPHLVNELIAWDALHGPKWAPIPDDRPF